SPRPHYSAPGPRAWPGPVTRTARPLAPRRSRSGDHPSAELHRCELCAQAHPVGPGDAVVTHARTCISFVSAVAFPSTPRPCREGRDFVVGIAHSLQFVSRRCDERIRTLWNQLEPLTLIFADHLRAFRRDLDRAVAP